MPFVLGKSFIFAHPVFSIYQFKTYPKNMSKILIVDDEVQIRTLLARMMELEGYEVCLSLIHISEPTRH